MLNISMHIKVKILEEVITFQMGSFNLSHFPASFLKFVYLWRKTSSKTHNIHPSCYTQEGPFGIRHSLRRPGPMSFKNFLKVTGR